MKVVLDANIFYTDPTMSDSDFQVFVGSLGKVGHELILPQVVFDEIVNNYRKRLQDSLSKLKPALAGVRRLLEDPKFEVTRLFDLDEERSRFETALRTKLLALGARILPHPKVSHEALLKRAISKSKPFNEKGAGYRDALIWEALLEDLARDTAKPIAFVTENSKDFGGTPVHEDLRRDISSRGLPEDAVAIFGSLAEFNDVHITPHLKKLDAVADGIRGTVEGSFPLFEWIRDYLAFQLGTDDIAWLLSVEDTDRIYEAEVERIFNYEVDEVRQLPHQRNLLLYATAEVNVEVREVILGDSEMYAVTGAHFKSRPPSPRRRGIRPTNSPGPRRPGPSNIRVPVAHAPRFLQKCSIGFSLILSEDQKVILGIAVNDVEVDGARWWRAPHPRPVKAPGANP